MQCYTELLPPTGVTQSLFAHFVSPNSNNLIVAKTSLLQVYDLVSVGPPEVAGQGTTTTTTATPTTKLVLIAEYKLSGVVADLGRVKILDTKTGGDAVLVSVRDAKISLIEWDPETRGISTISIHYYERADLNWNPWVPDLSKCPTKLSVDPGSRCAMLQFAQRKLAILPFRQVGDDLMMDEFDAEFGVDEPMTDADAAQTPKSQSQNLEKPHKEEGSLLPSFVLPIMELDSNISHPVDITFLHEYREPTFGILYSQTAPSSSLLAERRDVMVYSIVTLDLEQRESTTLVSLPRLPSDLFKVVSLPLPVGGALLIGSNVILHVDQSGKANAVGVNDYAKKVSSFSMLDQSHLGLRLEDCVVEQLRSDNGEILFVLNDGTMAVLSFEMDGRSVSKISLTLVPDDSVPKVQPSCSSFLGDSMLFLGSEESDSVLIGLSSSTAKVSGKRSRNVSQADDGSDVGAGDEEGDDGDDDIYEDDLYASDSRREARPNSHQISTETSNPETYVLREHDRLLSIGPMKDTTFARPLEWHNASKTPSHISSPELELVTAQGHGSTGSLSILRRALDPFVEDSFECPKVTGAWSVSVEGEEKQDSTGDAANFNKYLILAKEREEENTEESVVYTITPSGLEEYKAPEFNPNGLITIDILALAGGRRVVQVLNGEVRTYDGALELSQIYPVWDEDNEEDHPALSVTFADPYFVIIRDNHSVLILQSDESGELDELEAGEVITSGRYVSASLYRDSNHFFVPKQEAHQADKDNVLLFLLREDGQFSVFHLPNLTKPVYTVTNIDFLPPNICPEFSNKRQAFRETIVEILVAELGDFISHAPRLILRTETDDLAVYEPYRPSGSSQEVTAIQFKKVTDHSLPSLSNETTSRKSRPMRALSDISGYKAVFVPGPYPRFVMKTSKSYPHAIPLRGQATHLSGLHTEKCRNGFVYVDDKGIVRIGRLPKDLNIDLPWTLRRVSIGERIDSLVYSPSDNLYVLGINKNLDFKLPDDSEIHPEWREEKITFKPQVESGVVKLLQPDGWSIIHSFDISPHEQITTVKCLNLEVSEITHEHKNMIVVGTAMVQGEDIPSRGCIHVFEIVDVVPDPDHPERNRKLKPFAQEKTKGPVTGLSTIGDQGFLIAAEGIKCMVRGLKEDGSLLPVAFMDMQCCVSVVKELRGTGLCVMADALKGVWFTGYSEEPYKLTRFSKDIRELAVVAADFLPDGKSLYILAADADCNINVLQYDPEDPSSSEGDLLLHRGSFHTGHFATNIALLPRTSRRPAGDVMDLDDRPTYQALVTSQTGSIALVTCVQEEAYRRLSALQSQLTHTLEHACSLNPRAFRAVESDGVGGRGMVDGNLLLKWFDLGTHRRAELANRVGADVWEVCDDLAMVSGRYGLEYL